MRDALSALHAAANALNGCPGYGAAATVLRHGVEIVESAVRLVLSRRVAEAHAREDA